MVCFVATPRHKGGRQFNHLLQPPTDDNDGCGAAMQRTDGRRDDDNDDGGEIEVTEIGREFATASHVHIFTVVFFLSLYRQSWSRSNNSVEPPGLWAS